MQSKEAKPNQTTNCALLSCFIVCLTCLLIQKGLFSFIHKGTGHAHTISAHL